MKIMVWNAARGGMRTVVEGYESDGFLAAQDVHLVAAYADGGFVYRQFLFAKALVKFVALLMTRKVELVHCHVAMYGSFWRKSSFAVIARRFGVPVILHLHGSEMRDFYSRQPRFAQRAIVRQLTKAQRVLVLSESWKAFVGEIAHQARVMVLPNYVVVPPAHDMPAGADFTIAFLGALGPRKGIYDLLHAVAKARVAVPGLSLLVGGNGEIEQVRAQVRILGLQDHVTLLGWVGPDRRRAVLQSAHLFALPSYNEGLPMSLLEAMSHGVPVLTTPVGGIPELVRDDVEGRLVSPGDVSAMAETIVELARDPVLSNRMGRAARRRVERIYSGDIVLPQLAEIYRAVGAE